MHANTNHAAVAPVMVRTPDRPCSAFRGSDTHHPVVGDVNELHSLPTPCLVDYMDVKSTIIEAAAGLLSKSTTGDVSTRAVSEAAGVQQVVIYRHFSDKDTLMAAVVDYAFREYTDAKKAAVKSEDPLDDLRSGWDTHVAFAVAHPNFYRLFFSPALTVVPQAAEETLRLLLEVLHRLADQGRLRLPAEVAGRMIMAANTGVALALITRPALYPDAAFSLLVRDAVHAAVLLYPETLPYPETTSPEAGARVAAASTLLSSFQAAPPPGFTPSEANLFLDWLGRVASPVPAQS
jgi:AcrR family transcriptional regulator